MLNKYIAVSLLLAVGACGDEGDEISETAQSATVVQHASDAANPPGTAGFYFLGLLADGTPTFSGTFNAGFKTRLKIDIVEIDCTTFAVGATLRTLTSVLAYATEYKVGTNVTTLGMVTGRCYRVIPKLDNAALGFRDGQVTNGTQPAGLKKWTPGQNLAITFRLEGSMDADSDTVLNHVDNCPTTSNSDQADTNSNGVGDVCEPIVDTDGDTIGDGVDNCPTVANTNQANADMDAAGDACETCSADPFKLSPGLCGCGTADTHPDLDGTPNCFDGGANDPGKTSAGQCGCGTPDTDTDLDGTANCAETCDPFFGLPT